VSAADAYDVRDVVEGLFDNAKDMRRLRLTFTDVKLGIDVHDLMDRANVPLQKRPEVMNALGAIVREPNPKKALNTAVELTRHVEANHLSYDEVVPGYDQHVRGIRDVEEEERRKTTKNAAKKEQEIRRTTSQEQKRVKRTTREVATKLTKIRETEEERARQAREENGRLIKAIGKNNVVLRKVTRDVGTKKKELTDVQSKKRNILARIDKVEQADQLFAKLDVTQPEEKAALLREVEIRGGNLNNLVEALRQYGSVERALKKARAKTVEERHKLRDVKTSLREHDRDLDRALRNLDEVQEKLVTTRTERKHAKNQLKYIVGRIAKAEGVEKSMGGLREALDRVTKQLEIENTKLAKVIENIARAHGAEPTLEGLKRREEEYVRSLLDLQGKVLREGEALKRLNSDIGNKNQEITALLSAKNDLDGYFETAGKTLDSIEARAKEVERLQLILSLFSERIPIQPWNAMFEAMAALLKSFLTYLSLVMRDTPQVIDLRFKVGQASLALGNVLRTAR
jgi:myosin heavy subunit